MTLRTTKPVTSLWRNESNVKYTRMATVSHLYPKCVQNVSEYLVVEIQSPSRRRSVWVEDDQGLLNILVDNQKQLWEQQKFFCVFQRATFNEFFRTDFTCFRTDITICSSIKKIVLLLEVLYSALQYHCHKCVLTSLGTFLAYKALSISVQMGFTNVPQATSIARSDWHRIFRYLFFSKSL